MRYLKENGTLETLERPAQRALKGVIPVRPIAQTRPTDASSSLVEYGARRMLVVAGVMMAALLQTIDITIVNVALPTIQGNLGASIDQGTWVMTGYVIANVVVIPITPWLQRRFGRKNYFLLSIAGFTVFSVFCGLATSLPMLIAFRVVQGLFGGGLLSTAQVVMRDTFAPAELGTSQSIFSLGTVLGPSIGPTLGGILTDNFSWPFIFLVNIVPGILALILIARYLRDAAPAKREPVDLPGIVLLIATVSALQFALDQGQMYDWFSDSRIVAAFLISAGALGTFVWHELRTPMPIVDLRVLRYRGVAIAGLTSMVNAITIFGVVLLLPQFAVSQLGFTSTLAGMLMGTRALPVLFLSMLVGRIANARKIDLRFLLAGGFAVSGLGSVWLALRVTPDAGYWTFAPALLLCGIGISFIFPPLLVAALRAAPPSEGAKASSIIVLALQLGGSVASALIVAFWDRRADFHQNVLAAHVSLGNPAVVSFLQFHPVTQLAQQVVSQAATLAYIDAFWLVGWISIAFVPVLYFLKPWRSSS